MSHIAESRLSNGDGDQCRRSEREVEEEKQEDREFPEEELFSLVYYLSHSGPHARESAVSSFLLRRLHNKNDEVRYGMEGTAVSKLLFLDRAGLHRTFCAITGSLVCLRDKLSPPRFYLIRVHRATRSYRMIERIVV